MSKFEDLKEFINIAKDSGAIKLEYEMKDKKYFVSFENDQIVTAPAAYQAAPMAASQASTEASTASKDPNLLEVTSPFVGTFYRSPSPTADAFVKAGDTVSPGKVLCIVEAMKIMNEIESEVSGEIVEVCVENETYVEFGQVLYRIKP